MQTALLSDVHGNAVAFRAVVDELAREGIDRAVCLGDMVQGGPQPVECLEILGARDWPVVLGNADDFVLDPRTAEAAGERVTPPQLEMRAWSRDQLSEEQAGTIAEWPPTVEVDLGHGRRLLAFHATPRSYAPLLFPTAPEEEFRELLGPVEADLASGGHTHIQFVRRAGRCVFVNPGSVGFGYDPHQAEADFGLDAWASYAVVTTGASGLRIDLRRVSFDALAVAQALRSCGMPHGADRALLWERGAAPA